MYLCRDINSIKIFHVSHSAGNSSLAHLAHRAFTVTDAHTATQTHLRRIQCSIHQISDFYMTPNHKSSSQVRGATLCVALLSLSDCVQQDKAIQVTFLLQCWIREQTGLTKSSLTVTLSCALGGFSWSSVRRSSVADSRQFVVFRGFVVMTAEVFPV